MRLTLLTCLLLPAACSSTTTSGSDAPPIFYVDSDGDGLPDRIAMPDEGADATAWIDSDGDGVPDQRVER